MLHKTKGDQERRQKKILRDLGKPGWRKTQVVAKHGGPTRTPSSKWLGEKDTKGCLQRLGPRCKRGLELYNWEELAGWLLAQQRLLEILCRLLEESDR